METLAARRGRDLEADGVAIVPIGGAHAIARFVKQYKGARLVGLCDDGEREVFRRAGMERFEVCVADLEDELIRALGGERVQELLARHGSLSSFRTFQRQPAWRGRPVDAQLRRFLGSSDRRKIRYARILVEDAVDRMCVPAPLDGVLAHI